VTLIAVIGLIMTVCIRMSNVWTNDSQDKDDPGSTGSQGQKQANQEQDAQQAIEG